MYWPQTKEPILPLWDEIYFIGLTLEEEFLKLQL